MDDQATTTEEVVETGAEAQPVETTETAAVQEDVTSDQAEATEPSDDNPNGFDEDTLSWMTAKGIDPSSPDALTKVAKSAREAEKAMHSKAQKASELEKAMDDGITQEAQTSGLTDDDRVEIVRIKTKLSVREFFDDNPEAKQYEAKMIEVLANKPHLAGDLESLYANALRASGDTLKSEGAKEALQSLAGKQRAAAPTGAAVSSATTPNRITRDLIAQKTQAGDIDWLTKNQDRINAAVADGTL